ncbi:UDP-glucose 4-epimerase [Methylopila capsulata]|uniref:UDP-glucose 4-epimerase n=1 Tax=Methylopila capsulata TaxID=61654 RepID=A0A9W6IS83_9HYPH|nr:UDP-glucose 4-epimerase GalE [Methylopila capsulata]MBM7849947.1 UDP-glucose 4-epimerase [Methylopila capsulata]GLK55238.1 UDP-glucose 4-epimerase GalE [Methylopila capsulata]
MTSSNVLVTGGAGYIGSHMILALRDAGRPVVVLDDLSTGLAAAVPAGVPLVRGCVGDADLVTSIARTYRVGAIVHFAGSIVVPDSVADPMAYYLNNTVRSRELISAAVAVGVRNFVFSSTAAVYGEASAEPLGEDTPLAPVSPYGASKLMTERMLADAGLAYGLRYAALRYFNVAGADPLGRAGQSGGRATHLIKLAAQAAVGLRAGLDCFGDDYPTRDGTCVRDYIHVSDLVQAHMLALGHLEGGGPNLVANCGYGFGASVREVIGAMKRASGVDFPVRPAPRRAGDPAALVADATRLRETLGWVARHDDLDGIVASALAWERRLAETRRPAFTAAMGHA